MRLQRAGSIPGGRFACWLLLALLIAACGDGGEEPAATVLETTLAPGATPAPATPAPGEPLSEVEFMATAVAEAQGTATAQAARATATVAVQATAAAEVQLRATAAAVVQATAVVEATASAAAAQATRAAAAAVAGDEALVPASPFQMGCSPDDSQCEDDEKPLRQVALGGYFIDAHEVTNARYAACVEAGACTPPHDGSSVTRDSYYGDPEFADYPVVNVDWFQAGAFCRWEGKRLPTEAEWEKAARGSDGARIYPWGDAAPTCDLLNFWPEGSESACVGDTAAVGAYPAGASPYGVMDLGGSVWEWVQDWYTEDAYSAGPAANPQGPDSGIARVLRGGYWGRAGWGARVSDRARGAPGNWYYVVGFRCARLQ